MILLADALLPLLAAAKGETAEAPPVAGKARLFRGSGAIGGPDGAGNRSAATVYACGSCIEVLGA